MKTLVSIVLAALMAATASAELQFIGYTDSPPQTAAAIPKDGGACVLLILATVAAGGAIIIWLFARNKDCCAGKRLILERDCNCGTWLPIATNDVAEHITVTNKWMVFAHIVNSPTNEFCRFRIHITDIPEECP